METTYRFRFLIYVAAFMLVMSLCFVYAEPLPSQNHLLFQVAPQHAGFLAPSAQEPAFDPSALRAAAPMVSPQALQQLEDASHGHRGLFHRAKHAAARPLPAANVQSESSALGVTVASPAAVASTR
jgi:hypothetical protein